MATPLVITSNSPNGGNDFAIYKDRTQSQSVAAPTVPVTLQEAMETLQQIKISVDAVIAQMNQANTQPSSSATDFEAEYILTKS